VIEKPNSVHVVIHEQQFQVTKLIKTWPLGEKNCTVFQYEYVISNENINSPLFTNS
jgi:hypothetical protein